MSSEKNNTALTGMRTLRQAFFAASTLIIVGLLGAYFVHVYFLALPALVAGGLMFSALVGWCPMIFFLEKAPWNR